MNNQPPYPPPYPSPALPRPNAPNAPNLPNAPGAAKRLSPEQSRRRARILKRVALAGTTLAFCSLSGLAASHVVGVTSADASSAAPTVAPSQHDDHGGFFQDGNSDDEDQHNGQSGGFNFGSGGNFQPPSSTSGGS
jgi:hypothetical protein